MRVAHVITRLIVGGAQENTVSTVLGLHQKNNVTVRLYSGPTSGPEGSLESSVQQVDGPRRQAHGRLALRLAVHGPRGGQRGQRRVAEHGRSEALESGAQLVRLACARQLT